MDIIGRGFQANFDAEFDTDSASKSIVWTCRNLLLRKVAEQDFPFKYIREYRYRWKRKLVVCTGPLNIKGPVHAHFNEQRDNNAGRDSTARSMLKAKATCRMERRRDYRMPQCLRPVSRSMTERISRVIPFSLEGG